MATIPHVAAGPASSSAQNALIDQVNSNTNALSSPIGARVSLSTAFTASISTTVYTISWDTVDPGAGSGMVNLTSNPTRVTITSAGLYIVSSYVSWAANATGSRGCLIYLNGAEIAGDRRNAVSASGTSTTHTVTAQKRLAVNDYLEVDVFQSSGGTLATAAGSLYLAVSRLSL